MEHGLLAGQPPPSRELLAAWLDKHNVQRSDAITIAPMADGTGWRALAARDLAIGETICKIPKSALLSARTCSLPPLTDAPVLTTAHSILGLALALLHELRLGPDSSFWGYLQSLPRETVPIPALWPLCPEGSDAALALKWLQGTEAERDLRRREREGVGLAQVQEYYAIAANHLPPTRLHPDSSPFADFAYAFSLVSTRAFAIDLYHTVALCPYADILNHSARAHTSLASDDFVCHKCGQLTKCEHDLFPPGDYSDVPHRLSHLEPREIERISRVADTVDMYIEWPVRAGHEVMNSYGEGIGEARLLVEWGFVPGSWPSQEQDYDDDDDDDDRDDDEYAGDGLTWDADELTAAGGDVEGWAAMEPTVGNFLLKSDEYEGAGLLCEISPRPGVCNLNHLGKVSSRLYGVLYAGEPGGTDVEEFVKDITQSVRVWGCVQAGEEAPEMPITMSKASSKTRDLIKARIASLYRPELDVGQLYDIRAALAPEDRLQTMAMTLVINEMALLKSAGELWDELLQSRSFPEVDN